MLSISSYNSAFAINLSRAVSKAVSTVHVGETGLNWEKTLTLVFARALRFPFLPSEFGLFGNRDEMGRNIRIRPFRSQSSIFISGSTRKRKISTAARPCARASCRVNNSWQANSFVLTYLSCWSSNCTKSRSRYTPRSSVCRGKRTVQRKKIQVLP